MINGSHIIIYSTDPEADRAFFRDVLGFPHVDAGHGWLIFALPSAESAFHPADENGLCELYLMCDDVHAEIAAFEARRIPCEPPVEAPWGIATKVQLPGGGQIGLYQPTHPRPMGA